MGLQDGAARMVVCAKIKSILMVKLQQALRAITTDLARFAARDDYWTLFADVFGSETRQTASQAIRGQLRRQDLGQLARVEVISGDLPGGANAAYATSSNTILLSERFLGQATISELRAVLLEEIGHAIDARVNLTDRAGDEGELFSLVVRGLTPSASERARLLAEDDHRTLQLPGGPLAVEQAAPVPVVYETTTVNSAGSQSYGYYKISGMQAVWQQKKGVNHQLRLYNGSASTTIANSVYREFGDFAISGNTIAYTKYDGQDDEVYRYAGGVTTRLTTNTGYDGDLLVEGATVVWQGREAGKTTSDLFRNNGIKTTRITNNSVDEQDVQLSGSNLVWVASDGNDHEIYFHDGKATKSLTNNTLDDYSPVLKGDKVAWFQWNNNQENLLFHDGKAVQQVATGKEVYSPVIAGNNLVYQQLEPSGNLSLQLYNSTTKRTTQLSADLFPFSDEVTPQLVATDGALVAWLEKNQSNQGENSATLKLYDGVTTRTVTINAAVTWGSEKTTVVLRGTKLFFMEPRSYILDSGYSSYGTNKLFMYDLSSPSPNAIELANVRGFYSIDGLDVVSGRILWSSDDKYTLYMSQPSTKPRLTLNTTAVTVAEPLLSDKPATFTVTLSAPSSVPVSVRYKTYSTWEDGDTASSGSDYQETSGLLNFPAGTTTQKISIPILYQSWDEPAEKFHLILFDPTNAVVVPGQNDAVITITDYVHESWQTRGVSSASFFLPAEVDDSNLESTWISGGPGADRLTGQVGSDIFDYRVLTDSLLSTGIDSITDFQAGASGDRLLVNVAPSSVVAAGAVSALTAAAIGARLTTSLFPANAAATFQVGSGSTLRSFVAINDATAGFSPLTDAVVEFTGLTGTIAASTFVTS